MLEIMHKFINNYDIIGQNVGQIRQTSGTKSETTGTIVPVVNMLKYALLESDWGCSQQLNPPSESMFHLPCCHLANTFSFFLLTASVKGLLSLSSSHSSILLLNFTIVMLDWLFSLNVFRAFAYLVLNEVWIIKLTYSSYNDRLIQFIHFPSLHAWKFTITTIIKSRRKGTKWLPGPLTMFL